VKQIFCTYVQQAGITRKFADEEISD